MTDLARLLLARACLQQGFDRVIWVDADVVIFSPDLLQLDRNLSYGFSREVWVYKDDLGKVSVSVRVNNSVCMFCNDHIGRRILDQYISACISTVEGLPQVQDHTEVGTKLLTSLDREAPLPILNGFGLVSPLIIQALLTRDDDLLTQFMYHQGAPLYAVNLCNFFRAHQLDQLGIIPDGVFLAVLDELLTSKGSILNARMRT